MTDTTSNNIINTQPPAENTSREDLRLLSVKRNNYKDDYGELALISKREAKSILRLGSDSLNELIKKGDIKVTLINKRYKIPFVSIQEYINKVSSESLPEFDKFENDNEEESISMAKEIIQEILKGR